MGEKDASPKLVVEASSMLLKLLQEVFVYGVGSKLADKLSIIYFTFNPPRGYHHFLSFRFIGFQGLPLQASKRFKV